MNGRALLQRLLARGDSISIQNGQLQISPASGRQPPLEWMRDHAEVLVSEILRAVGEDAFLYRDYSTGFYGRRRSGGVTLQFESVVNREPAYVIFNADLKRLRGAKKGAPLPPGQFRVGERSNFYKFWQSTNLALPRRLSALHDYMGNLKGIFFSGDVQNERLDAGTLRPLQLLSNEVRYVLPDNSRAIPGHSADTVRTIPPNMELPQSLTGRGIHGIQTTGVFECGNTVTRDAGTRGKSVSGSNPCEQSNEQWLSDYENARVH